MAEQESNKTDLPNTWVWTTLNEVTFTIQLRRYPQDYPGLRYVGLEHIQPDTMRLLGTQSASERKSMADYFNSGDVLYARLRPYLNKVYRPDFEGLCSSEFIVFRELEYLSNKYLQYLLNTGDFVSYAMSKITGDRPRVDIADIGEFPFPLAPLNEQYRIVEEIETQFSQLDKWLEAMQQLREQIPGLRASILKTAVEGRLTEHDPQDESAEALLQRIRIERRRTWEEEYLADLQANGKPIPQDETWKEKYKEPESPDTSTLPLLPEGWAWATIDELAEVQGGIQKQPVRNPKEHAYPYLRVANVYRNSLDLSEIYKFELFEGELEKYRLELGDILIVEGNGSIDQIGRCSIWQGQIENCVHQNHIIRARFNHILPEYVSCYLNSSIGMEIMANAAATTSGLYTLSVSKIKKIIIPVPSKNEQKRIIDIVSAFLSVLDRIQETINDNTKRAERMRQSVLKKAFAGQLVEQDTNDEPASTLLERIQDERKRRAEEEKHKPKRQRKRTMSTEQIQRKSLYKTLQEAGKPLAVRDLFEQAGFTHELIDEFFEEIRRAITIDKIIRSQRNNEHGEIILEVVA